MRPTIEIAVDTPDGETVLLWDFEDFNPLDPMWERLRFYLARMQSEVIPGLLEPRRPAEIPYLLGLVMDHLDTWRTPTAQYHRDHERLVEDDIWEVEYLVNGWSVTIYYWPAWY